MKHACKPPQSFCPLVLPPQTICSPCFKPDLGCSDQIENCFPPPECCCSMANTSLEFLWRQRKTPCCNSSLHATLQTHRHFIERTSTHCLSYVALLCLISCVMHDVLLQLLHLLQGIRQAALERQDLSCMYLACHELGSVS